MLRTRYQTSMMIVGLVMASTVSLATGAAPAAPTAIATTPVNFSLATWQDESQDEEVVSESTTVEERTTKLGEYHELSDFFNVREANANLSQGEWELEFATEWATGAGGDDDISIAGSLKYGISDSMFLELEGLPINLGDGGDQGAGDLAVILFNQIMRETETMPAFAVWAEMRVPTGEGSSGVDGEVHFNFTKELIGKLRGHLEGYVESANGGRGDEDENRRHFQWGTGFGADCKCTENMVLTVNYLITSSEEYGHSNNHVVELGAAYELSETQTIKVAFDIGVDGREETPDFATKILWSIEF